MLCTGRYFESSSWELGCVRRGETVEELGELVPRDLTRQVRVRVVLLPPLFPVLLLPLLLPSPSLFLPLLPLLPPPPPQVFDLYCSPMEGGEEEEFAVDRQRVSR